MKVAVCTICNAGYLPKAAVLFDSLHQHAPHWEPFLCLAETPRAAILAQKQLGVRVLSLDQIEAHRWKEMAFWYDVSEFCTALKPFLLRYLLNQGYQAVIFFDPDIEVYSPLGEVERALATAEAVVTPHICESLPEDGCFPQDEDLVRVGQFNLGFIALTDTPGTRRFLRWWMEKLERKCLMQKDHSFFVDQFYASMIPSFLESAIVLRHPSYNVAYWNLPHRPITEIAGKFHTPGGPLVFFHFSGLGSDLSEVSRYSKRVRVAANSPLYRLLSDYLNKVSRRQRQLPISSLRYSFEYYDDGEPICAQERRNYWKLSPEQREAWGSTLPCR